MKRIASLLFTLLLTVNLLHGQLIINHLNTNITTLTEAEINEAKSVLHIAYGHTSHGSQVTDGLTGLVGFANGGGKGLSFPHDIFAWNHGGTGGALNLHDYAMDGDVGYYPAWYNNTVNYLNSPSNSDVNVIMWSWCGQASGYTQQNMIDYFLTPMTLLETNYPNVKFVYFTGHLDGSGATGNLNLRDQQIRDYCIANHKILYDFEDIESYDPDGLVNYMELDATDNCDYDSSGFSRNWATRWQNTHTQNVDWYSCSCAHSQSLNGNQKAYAAWRMFADIAKMIELEAIPANLIVSDTIVGNTESACFDATDTLTLTGATDTVEFQNGSSVDLIAGKSIFLEPGFHAFEGSITHASITTDNQYCYTTAGAIVQNPPPKSLILKSSLAEGDNLKQEKSVKVFPNPNNGTFTLQLKDFENKIDVMMFNMVGKVVFHTTSVDADYMEINLPAVSGGIYSVSATDGVIIKTVKMIIQ